MSCFPRAPSTRVIFLLGAIAFCLGGIGLVQPAAQIERMGFKGGDASAQALLLMTIISLATINTALVYLYGAWRGWLGLRGLLIATRAVMGVGLLLLAVLGRGPSAFLAATAWEWIGAGLIVVARRWDSDGPDSTD